MVYFCPICYRHHWCDTLTACSFSPFLLLPLASSSFILLSVLLLLVSCACHFVQECLLVAMSSSIFLLLLHHGDKHGILVGYLLDVLLLFFSFMFHLCFHCFKVHIPFVCDQIADAFLGLSLVPLYLLNVMYTSSKNCRQFFHVLVVPSVSAHFVIISSKNQLDPCIWSATCMLVSSSNMVTFHFANHLFAFSICLK